jgi:REP element-mobilizing transposase RayT
MPYDPSVHHRRSIRLSGFDYTLPGAYYLTIVAQGPECLFGDIDNEEMRLSRFGMIVQRQWDRLAFRFPSIVLDAFIVMPDHIHGIIIVNDCTGTAVDSHISGSETPRRAPTHHEQFGRPVPGSIPTIVRSFKSATTLRINTIRQTSGASVWQRNYYEHIIRDEVELNRIRLYIANNPSQEEHRYDGEFS